MIRGRVYGLAALCLGLGAENHAGPGIMVAVALATLVAILWGWPRGQGPGGSART